jgi:hypothetical protein
MKYLGLSLVQRLNVQVNFNMIHWGSGKGPRELEETSRRRLRPAFPSSYGPYPPLYI